MHSFCFWEYIWEFDTLSSEPTSWKGTIGIKPPTVSSLRRYKHLYFWEFDKISIQMFFPIEQKQLQWIQRSFKTKSF